MTKTCYILVGPIASGKSTYSRKAAEIGDIIINDDAIVNAVHGGLYTKYCKELKPLYKAIETTIFTAAAALNRNVVVDRGLNVSEEARLRWIGLAKSFDYKVGAVVFKKETPEIHAKRRFDYDCRGRYYEHWLEAARRHDDIWVTPVLSEGFDFIEYPYIKF